ncbi:hypothetical protein BJF91_23670 [Allorhizobium taibaishanense]|uniref:Uncharacterized protein n=1 Tax=Allorhizobium taibaishanense TaxID=887144 RepID=A0A1Q9AAM8_9HYPH|nr:hypothetical protein BJF91_23670 [Allorhizobium taibaishanense]
MQRGENSRPVAYGPREESEMRHEGAADGSALAFVAYFLFTIRLHNIFTGHCHKQWSVKNL